MQKHVYRVYDILSERIYILYLMFNYALFVLDIIDLKKRAKNNFLIKIGENTCNQTWGIFVFSLPLKRLGIMAVSVQFERMLIELLFNITVADIFADFIGIGVTIYWF